MLELNVPHWVHGVSVRMDDVNFSETFTMGT